MKEFFLKERGIYFRTNNFLADRQTLVFVHGLSGSSSAWVEYEKKFEEKYNVLSFDLRGHGKSIKYPKYVDYEIGKFAEDIEALTSHLKIGKFILISHSFGVLTALEYLVRYQDKVLAAVFLSPSFSVRNRKAARIIRPLLEASRIIDLIPFSPRTAGHIDYSKYRGTGDWNVRRTIADTRNTGFRAYLFATKQTYAVDYTDFLENIKIPVLLVHGKKDTIFPVENSLTMAAKIKNPELVLLEKADHIVVLNNFPEVSMAIDNFLDKLNK